MRVVSYSWVDGVVASDVKIECECGNTFMIDAISDGSTALCKVCHKTEEFKLNHAFQFVPIPVQGIK